MGADRMKNADTLMAIYYVVLSGALVFALGYLAVWRHAKGRHYRVHKNRGSGSVAKLLTRDEARRIAAAGAGAQARLIG